MRRRPIVRGSSIVALAVVLLAALPAFGAPAAAADPAAVVTLRTAVRVSTDSVTLGQIADVTGRASVRALLSQIVVLPGLAPGSSVQIAASQARAAVAEAGFDLRAVSFGGADRVRIERQPATAAAAAGSASSPAESGVVLVRRGSVVRVIAVVNALRVTTTGIALASGGAGDVVLVRIAASRREVSAVVVERGVVAVPL